MTESSQTLIFIDPDSKEEVIADWNDLVEIYKEEQEGLLRQTNWIMQLCIRTVLKSRKSVWQLMSSTKEQLLHSENEGSSALLRLWHM